MNEQASTSRTILIGGYRPEDCHSEMDVADTETAIAYLHAFARKDSPEPAIANLDDYGRWISNEGFATAGLSGFKNRYLVETIIKQENEKDEQAEVMDNDFVPDITITPFYEGQVLISSCAMQHEAPCRAENITKRISELINEYRDLVEAGEVSKPIYA